MKIRDSIYGQAFMFDCGKYSGLYGSKIAEMLLAILGELKATGHLEYYAAHVPAWSQNWVVGLVLVEEPEYEFWKTIENIITEKLPENISFNGMEYADKLNMKSSLMFVGALQFVDGEVVTQFEAGDGNDYFQSLLRTE